MFLMFDPLTADEYEPTRPGPEKYLGVVHMTPAFIPVAIMLVNGTLYPSSFSSSPSFSSADYKDMLGGAEFVDPTNLDPPPSNPFDRHLTNLEPPPSNPFDRLEDLDLYDTNNSELIEWLDQLNPADLELLLTRLKVKDKNAIAGIKSANLPPIQPRSGNFSYDEQMMQFGAFQAHKILLLYIPPVLIILGTFGNVFSIIILRNKTMLKFSTYFYLLVMAVADTLVLYVGLLRLWVGELRGQDPMDQTDWMCKLCTTIGYTVSDFSVWLIITVTVERYMVVCHPFKASLVCNRNRACRIVLALLVIFLGLNLHFLWTVQIIEYQSNGESILRCDARPAHTRIVQQVWPWIDVMIYSLLPFVLISGMNGMIIRQVLIARGQRSSLRHRYQQRRPSQEGSTRLTVMLLTISFAFLITTLPMTIVSIATAFWNEYKDDVRMHSNFKLARTVTELLMYANHSLNFFLYCATGQKFRHQLVWMVCYAKKSYALRWGSGRAVAGDQSPGATRMDSMRKFCGHPLANVRGLNFDSGKDGSWKNSSNRLRTRAVDSIAADTCGVAGCAANNTADERCKRGTSAARARDDRAWDKVPGKYIAHSVNGLCESTISFKSAKGAASI